MYGRGPEPLANCTKLAAMQHGVLAARQAVAAGLSRKAVGKFVRAGHWARVRPSVYALWIPTDPVELWRQRLMAGTLWLAGVSAVSHRAGAVIWELDGIDSAPIELSTTGRRRASEAGLVLHRPRSLESNEVVVHCGLPVTSVPRTLLDLCAVVEPRAVELALESALRRGLATVPQIVEALRRAGSTSRGRGVLSVLLDQLPGTSTESALETLVWRLLRDGGLSLPVRQHEVRDERGRFVARVDFAYPDARIAIEADGHRFHSRKSDWARDLTRQNVLTRLGWIIYRITWEDATRRRREVLADLAELLPKREE